MFISKRPKYHPERLLPVGAQVSRWPIHRDGHLALQERLRHTAYIEFTTSSRLRHPAGLRREAPEAFSCMPTRFELAPFALGPCFGLLSEAKTMSLAKILDFGKKRLALGRLHTDADHSHIDYYMI